MLQKYTPPYVSILCLVMLCNVLLSTYFVSLLLVGVVFKIFSIAIRKEYNYVMLFSIITFLVIENTQGLYLFSLTIISLCIHYLVIPRVKHLLSSDLMSGFIYVFSFYVLFYLLVQLQTPFDIQMVMIFLLNFVIDIFIVGFVL